MFFKEVEQTYGNEPTILATEANLVAFTGQVSDVGVAPDAQGRKVVKKGSLLDVNGTIKNDGTVVGILGESVDVTEGPQAGSLIVAGFILKDRLPVMPSSTALATLKQITLR